MPRTAQDEQVWQSQRELFSLLHDLWDARERWADAWYIELTHDMQHRIKDALGDYKEEA
mgnify:FL=1